MKRARELAKAYDRRHFDVPVFIQPPAPQPDDARFARDVLQALTGKKRAWQV